MCWVTFESTGAAVLPTCTRHKCQRKFVRTHTRVCGKQTGSCQVQVAIV